MALRFQAPGFVQPQRYEGIANIGNTLDSIFNRYAAGQLQGQQLGLQQEQLGFQRDLMARQQQALDRERGLNLAQYGFDPAQVTQERYAQAQGNQMAGEDPGITALRGFLQRRKASESLLSRRQEAEAQKAEMEAGSVGTQRANKIEEGLRGEVNTLSKSFDSIRNAYGKIQKAANTQSAAGDLSLIFGYMRILDENSTVREGEFANAQNAAGIPDRIKNLYNRALRGERLTPEQRQDFLERAGEVYQSQLGIQKRMEQNYKDLARRQGGRPENVVLPRELPDQAPPPPPPAGGEIVRKARVNGQIRNAIYNQQGRFLRYE